MRFRTARRRIDAVIAASGPAVLVTLLTLAQASPALSGWREHMKVFRIGMIARDGAGQSVPGLSRIENAYSKALGMPVEIFVARDYAALIDAQATRRVDYAIYSATAYAAASLLCSCVEPVAAPLGADGAIGLAAILVTRDDGLHDISGIVGRRVAVAPADSITAFMLPAALTTIDSVATGSRADVVRAPTASAAEAMLVDGSADAIVGWARVDASGALSGGTLVRLAAAGLDRTSLKVIWQSPPLRYGPHALRSDLDGELRRTLVTFLTAARDLQPDTYELLDTNHGGGFVEARPRDYASAVAMVRHISGRFSDP